MTLSQEQLEWIVQEVVRRLASAEGADAAAVPTGGASQENLVVSEKLVTTHTLDGKLGGIKRLQVPSRAVVTPAARDLLRDCGIQLVCGL